MLLFLNSIYQFKELSGRNIIFHQMRNFPKILSNYCWLKIHTLNVLTIPNLPCGIPKRNEDTAKSENIVSVGYYT